MLSGEYIEDSTYKIILKIIVAMKMTTACEKTFNYA